MEQTKFQYPFYQSNQFLKSQDLNDSFSYLEEQERLTRSKIIGNGIVSGLDFDCNITNEALTGITVNTGFGVTSDGYTVDFPEAVLYEYMVLYSDYSTDKDILNSEKTLYATIPGITYLLFTADEINSGNFVFNSGIVQPININNSTYENFCVALAIDIKTETSFNCNPSDCNINSSTDNIIYRPVLINISSLEIINTFYPNLDYLRVQKISFISGINSVDDYNQTTQDILNNNVNLINNFCQQIITQVSGLLPNENSQLKNALQNFNSSVSGGFVIYYLSFFNDIQAAVNEFVNAYNNYIHKYTFSSASRIDKLLLLGLPFGDNTDAYRYNFIETKSNEQFKADSQILSQLHMRISLLMEAFIPSSALIEGYSNNSLTNKIIGSKKINPIPVPTPIPFPPKPKPIPIPTPIPIPIPIPIPKPIPIPIPEPIPSAIKIIPCKGYSEKLGNRAIPYYYNISENQIGNILLQYWHAHDLDTYNSLDLIYNYYWMGVFNPKSYDKLMLNLNDYPFYRIEGHLGVAVDTAYNSLSNLINELDIPIQLIKVDITNLAWIGFKTGFDQFASIYKNFLDDLNKQILSQGNNIVLTNISKNLNKISQNFCETSYRDFTGVSKILDDVNAYCNLIISSDFVAKTFKGFANYKVKVKTKSKTKTDTLTVPISQLIETTLKKYNIFDLRNSLAGLYAKPTPITEISLAQLKGLEYLAGVYKGGTFVLLFDGSLAQNPVIADFALPYFYNLDKGRLF